MKYAIAAKRKPTGAGEKVLTYYPEEQGREHPGDKNFSKSLWVVIKSI